jgi:ABC-type sulfate transport system permease component
MQNFGIDCLYHICRYQNIFYFTCLGVTFCVYVLCLAIVLLAEGTWTRCSYEAHFWGYWLTDSVLSPLRASIYHSLFVTVLVVFAKTKL